MMSGGSGSKGPGGPPRPSVNDRIVRGVSSSVPEPLRSSNTTRLAYATRAVTSPTMTSAAGSCDSVSVAGTSTAIGTLTDTTAGTKPNGSRQPASITAAASGDSAGSTQKGSVSHCAPQTSATRNACSSVTPAGRSGATSP